MNTRKNLFKLYWAIQKVIVPQLEHSQTRYEEVLSGYVSPDTRWLDLGCGHQILPHWRADQEKALVKNCKMVVGIDYDLTSLKEHNNISLKVRGTITRLPFKDESFDLVTANMVVEHLDDPEVQFSEVNRILKPGGLFIFHTPNALGYMTIGSRLVPGALKDKLIYLLDGRTECDVFETHYKANTPKVINKLAYATGFEFVKAKMIVSAAGFAVVPPLVIPELIVIRILMTRMFKPFRTNIIAILRKREDAA